MYILFMYKFLTMFTTNETLQKKWTYYYKKSWINGF